MNFCTACEKPMRSASIALVLEVKGRSPKLRRSRVCSSCSSGALKVVVGWASMRRLVETLQSDEKREQARLRRRLKKGDAGDEVPQ